MIFQLLACCTARSNQGAYRNCGSALNIIIETTDFIAVFFQQRHGIFLGKIFKLNQCLRPTAFHCCDDFIHKGIVFIPTDTWLAPSKIDRVIEKLLIIGPHINSDRQSIRWTDPATCGIQRQFSNRNPHPANPLIAQAQNTFTISDHDHLDVFTVDVVNNFINVFTVRIGNKHPAMTAVNIRKALTCLTHSRGIYNRHHFTEMVFNQVIKQRFVGVLDIS